MGGKHSKNTQSAGDLSDNDDQIVNTSSSQFRKKNQHSSRSNVSLADT